MATKRPAEEDPESGFNSSESPPSSSESGNTSKLVRLTEFMLAEPLRTSARVQRMKEERKESESETIAIVESEPLNIIAADQKQKRAWEQWSSEDKAIFFDALNEHGKNFDAIQMTFKNKKKSKNKEQIRTFYYRTWHKISKHVDFTEDYQHLKKSSKELYGLINFGELRKRLGSQLDDKTGVKLRELIFKGHTNVKIKGKSHRLKTPTCSALKRLTETIRLDDFGGGPYVPAKLTLNLSPMSTDDFDHIHRVALSNPHLSLSCRPGRSLSSVFDHLKQRWKSIAIEEMTFFPKKNEFKSVPKITVMDPTTSTSLSLSNLKKDLTETLATPEASNEVNDGNEASETEAKNVNAENESPKWNVNSAKNVSIGELFLMIGNGQTLELQYSLALINKAKSSGLAYLCKLATSELNKKPSSNPQSQASTSSGGASKAVKNLAFESTEKKEEASETSEFRRPSLPLSKPTIQQHQAFRQQLVNLMPRYNQRKGRPLTRPKRPSVSNGTRTLQPAPTIKSTDGQVKVRLMPAGITVTHPVISIQPSSPMKIVPLVSPEPTVPTTSAGYIPKNLEIENNNSNDSISAALSFFDPCRSDQFLDSVLENSNSSVLQTPPRVRTTPPSSPSRVVTNDSWDLSSFLNTTPSKATSGSSQHHKMHVNEDSVQSTGSEVDRQLLSMMSESSVDFTSKFAKLASAVVGNPSEET